MSGESASDTGAVDVVRALLRAWDSGDVATAGALIAPDFHTSAHLDGSPVDRERYLRAHAGLQGAFPDMAHHIVELAETSPGRVRAVVYMTATNDRPVRLPEIGVDLDRSTGRVLRTVPHTDEFVVRDGQIVSYTSEQPPGAGLAGMLEQIRKGTDG